MLCSNLVLIDFIDLFELFDLQTDPFEKKNVSATHAEVVQKMKTLLVDWKATLPTKPTGNVFSAERKLIGSTENERKGTRRKGL